MFKTITIASKKHFFIKSSFFFCWSPKSPLEVPDVRTFRGPSGDVLGTSRAGWIVWAHNFSSIKRILILQKKAVRIINFQPRNFHTSSLFKQNFILKFRDKICLENILFVSRSLNNLSQSIFNT